MEIRQDAHVFQIPETVVDGVEVLPVSSEFPQAEIQSQKQRRVRHPPRAYL